MCENYLLNKKKAKETSFLSSFHYNNNNKDNKTDQRKKIKRYYLSGRMKNAEKAKHIKTIPPTNVTVFGDIR
jgi:hypothetical protein